MCKDKRIIRYHLPRPSCLGASTAFSLKHEIIRIEIMATWRNTGSHLNSGLSRSIPVGTSFSTSHSVYNTLKERYSVHTYAYTAHSVHNTLQ